MNRPSLRDTSNGLDSDRMQSLSHESCFRRRELSSTEVSVKSLISQMLCLNVAATGFVVDAAAHGVLRTVQRAYHHLLLVVEADNTRIHTFSRRQQEARLPVTLLQTTGDKAVCPYRLKGKSDFCTRLS